MQTALGSFRSAGASKPIPTNGENIAWGIGTEGLILSGNYRFRVIRGSISLYGITLSAQSVSVWYDISASVPPYQKIKPVGLHSSDKEDGSAIPSELSAFPSVIEVGPPSPDFFPSLRELAPQFKSLWHPTIKLDNEDIDPASVLEIPKSWSDVEVNRAKRFIVLGPKNSGKSSFCRYLVNQFLLKFSGDNNTQRVFYMELDPGQPEYTTPGNLSLHVIKTLQFSPPYAHANFEHTVISSHFGYTSPIDTPHRYLDMCSHLFKQFEEISKPHDILVVNTPGWVKGLGLEINTELVGISGYDKTEVVHMGSSEFAMLVTEIERMPGLTGSSESTTTITSGGYSSAELRNLQISCHLHKTNVAALTQCAPYVVPLGTEEGVWSIGVLDSAGIILPDDLEICIEGTLVSLNLVPKSATVTQFCMEELEANDIWRISRSVSLAVVQSMSSQSIRLLTPFKPSEIDFSKYKVILLRGRIQLPTWEIAESNIKTAVPWIAVDKPVGIGSAYTKFRRNIQRN